MVEVTMPCGHKTTADHDRGERLFVCGCQEPVNPKKPDGEQKPVKWAIAAVSIHAVNYTPRKVTT